MQVSAKLTEKEIKKLKHTQICIKLLFVSFFEHYFRPVNIHKILGVEVLVQN